MSITITGDNLKVTDELRQYATDKIRKLDKFDDQIIDTEVVLRVESQRQTAEAKVNVPNKTLFADATTENMYSSIDELQDKLAVQIKNYKNKNNHRR